MSETPPAITRQATHLELIFWDISHDVTVRYLLPYLCPSSGVKTHIICWVLIGHTRAILLFLGSPNDQHLRDLSLIAEVGGRTSSQ
jgi:hypothetical protein